MGNIRRIKRSMFKAPPRVPGGTRESKGPRIAMVDAHMVVDDCRVFIGHPNPDHAKKVAKGFQAMMTETLERAQKPNLGDLYKVMVGAHAQLLEECN